MSKLFFAISSVILCMNAVALGAEPTGPQPRPVNAVVTDLAKGIYLPIVGIPAGEVTFDIAQEGRAVIRETFIVPPNDGNAVLELLGPITEWAQVLRDWDAASPGSVTVTIEQAGAIIALHNISELDALKNNVIGKQLVEPQNRKITIFKIPTGSRHGLVRQANSISPTCEQMCRDAYDECYARCDERGGSCAVCSQEWGECLTLYADQVSYPESAPVNYATYRYLPFECYGFGSIGDLYQRVDNYYRVDVYKKVVHPCDGSTDITYDHTYTYVDRCYELMIPQGCINPPQRNPPGCQRL